MARRSHTRPPGEVRIIGGAWRGRRLPVPELEGLRPTADRIRETLFNWLAPHLAGCRCLDLFAGTGALGIEALSRGAAGAVFVERDRGAAAMLNASLERLGAVGAEVIVADAGRYLRGTPASFDLVFLDPPFHAGGPSGLGQLCTLLAQGWLAAGARVYLEMPASELVPALPPPWQLLRDKTAGQVRYALAAWSPAER